MFDLTNYEPLKKCECLDNIQMHKFRKFYKDGNGKNCDFYTNNDIRNIINRANNKFAHFILDFEKEEMSKRNYKILSEHHLKKNDMKNNKV